MKYDDVLITWNKILSITCTENDTSVENCMSLHDKTSYMITDLKAFTEYNITVCINSSICATEIVMTNEAGIIYLLFDCLCLTVCV